MELFLITKSQTLMFRSSASGVNRLRLWGGGGFGYVDSKNHHENEVATNIKSNYFSMPCAGSFFACLIF
jgi:hypothetical protein